MPVVRTRTCQHCNTEFNTSQYAAKFCSVSCRTKARLINIQKSKRFLKESGGFYKCAYCDVEYERDRNQKHPFCSIVCRSQFHQTCKSEKNKEEVDQLYKIQKNSFISTGAYAEGSTFTPSDKYPNVYSVLCMACNDTGESRVQYLKQGRICCSCGTNNQRQAYIHMISNGDTPLALKFGVSNSTRLRIVSQSRTCIYKVKNIGVYLFELSSQCKLAERECKQTLDCGVLTKEEMPDGCTESTWVYNLEKIISIYEKHGGVRIEDTII